MTLVDDIHANLPLLRAQAESKMVDTCIIVHPTTGTGTFDSTTGTYTEPATEPVYVGPCQVQVTDSLNANDTDVGERQITLLRTIVKIPVGVLGVEVNDIVTITATGAVSDPALVGKQFRVDATHAKTYATARRLQCEQVAD